MKKISLVALTLISVSTHAQTYSSYYGRVDVNEKVEVDATVNKTIKTIDYGALAAANAQKEANRLNARQYNDQQEAIQAAEIAADPFAAFRYGKYSKKLYYRSHSRKYFKDNYGHFPRRVEWNWTAPSTLLFSSTGFGEFRNTSSDGSIVTEIDIAPVYDYAWARENYSEVKYPESISTSKEYVEMFQNWNLPETSKTRNGVNFYTHKSEIGTATVYGKNGYVWTWIYESDYDYVIYDAYMALSGGTLFRCNITYKVSKSRGTFEDLEGRRYYLRRLGEEVIATAYFRYF